MRTPAGQPAATSGLNYLRLSLARPIATLARRLAGPLSAQLATISTRVSDRDPGWGTLSGRPHERTWAEVQELYTDTIEAWRKNPLAKRAVDITADYVIGDGIVLNSPYRPLQAYIEAFWNHRKNLMANRLEAMCHEFTLAGDLFPVLFLNRHDGLSYIRFVTKDQIVGIETAANDWETELVYKEAARAAGHDRPVRWPGAGHPAADEADAVMLHYAVNRPVGTLLGEGDLATMIPWLLRYSRMLEDRVRVHAAIRAFLWFVQVPGHKVEAKQQQYNVPPDAGSIVVHDDGESWDVKTPNLNASDAGHDLEAVRRMIFTGSGFPPHWYGERGSNRAEAAAMQSPAERHLRRRQNYFVFVLSDLAWHGYRRARRARAGLPRLPSDDYRKLFAPAVPDVSRSDNAELAAAARDLTAVWKGLVLEQEGRSRTLSELLLGQVFRAMGEPQEAHTIRKITDEIFSNLDGDRQRSFSRSSVPGREYAGDGSAK